MTGCSLCHIFSEPGNGASFWGEVRLANDFPLACTHIRHWRGVGWAHSILLHLHTVGCDGVRRTGLKCSCAFTHLHRCVVLLCQVIFSLHLHRLIMLNKWMFSLPLHRHVMLHHASCCSLALPVDILFALAQPRHATQVDVFFALAQTRHATQVDVLLHLHRYVMLFNCTDTSCYYAR